MKVKIDEHEIGYIALHVHAAIEDEKYPRPCRVRAPSGNASLWWSSRRG